MGNYRGIYSFCRQLERYWQFILLSRLNAEIAKKQFYQSRSAGFRQNRGTTDMIFHGTPKYKRSALKQRQDLYQVFVDLTKALTVLTERTTLEDSGKVWDVLITLLN